MSQIIRCLVLILLSSLILTFVGLKVEKFKDYEIAGHVTLTKGERSKLASLAAEIL